jgi:hypothetical protein
MIMPVVSTKDGRYRGFILPERLKDVTTSSRCRPQPAEATLNEGPEQSNQAQNHD